MATKSGKRESRAGPFKLPTSASRDFRLRARLRRDRSRSQGSKTPVTRCCARRAAPPARRGCYSTIFSAVGIEDDPPSFRSYGGTDSFKLPTSTSLDFADSASNIQNRSVGDGDAHRATLHQFFGPKTLSRMTSLVFQMRAMVMASGRRARSMRSQKAPRSHRMRTGATCCGT